ncbi:MAG: MBL fold metallo-hydrolase [Anaerolineales bacterium]|nr:MBL fold metallo-hydrolase [Anaerolineales bacterium]MCB8951074.1 MBL fold metallo-hydrolase [Ardenticatenales bacterium]
MEVFPNVHWLDLGASNVYLLTGPDGLTLVDTGMPRQTGKILAYAEQLGHAPTDLRRILITHADIDHAGSMAALVQATGAEVYASRATADLLRQGRSPEHMPRLMQFLTNHFFRYKPVARVTVLEDGDELSCLGGTRIIYTPGHTLEHHSFYSPSTGVLLVGDALSTRDDQLNLSPTRVTADIALAQQTAQHLLSLAPNLFACGHGKPMRAPSSAELARFQRTLSS